MTIDKVMAGLNKRFGAGAIAYAAGNAPLECDVIPTGIATVDLALGVGGIPRGRITEFFGTEGGGKSTLVLHALRECQLMGLKAVFVDAEHAFDGAWAATIGIDLEKLIYPQPTTVEEMIEVIRALVIPEIALIAVDSIAALPPSSEAEGVSGDYHVGKQARLFAQAMRLLPAELRASNTALLLTNQIREKIGVMYGSPETTPGGRALKFAASIRGRVTRIAKAKSFPDGSVATPHKIAMKKNKVGPNFREAEFDIISDIGADRVLALIQAARKLGVVANKTGKRAATVKTPLYFDGRELGPTAEARSLIYQDPELFAAFHTATYEALHNGVAYEEEAA